ncbi:MAG: 2'-5' RNA ligase family protein, partial [Flavobacteriaceae bacterium]|nr:2'-5' RNA ligase family protein [Flavobacteriaceae bacterium]
MAKFFVGLNFSSDGLLSRKITGFRQRFDPKYNHYSFAHMSMLAPFEVHDQDRQDLIETLKEEMDTFFYEKKETPKLAFTGVGVYEYKRRKLLYLNPLYCSDLNFCSEVVLDICKSFIPRTVRYKENKRQFLPLGIFTYDTDLHSVMTHAKTEFENNSELSIESISLYENKMGIWVEREVLVNFEESESRFL